MNVLVAYESRGGHTRRSAEAIGRAAQSEGHDVRVRPIAEATPEELARADLVFVGSWVEGFLVFGVGPAQAAGRWIDSLPTQAAKPVAVFCSYALHPMGTLAELGARLRGRDATVVAEQAFHRSRPERGAEAFVARTLGEATRAGGTNPQ